MKIVKYITKKICSPIVDRSIFRSWLMITLLHWVLQGCVSTEALYAKYDQHACRVAIVETASGETLVQELGKVEPKTMGWEPAINFKTGDDTLDVQAKRLLDRDIAVLKQYRELRVNVRGYADKVGTEQFNRELSKRRAAGTVSYLVAGGISRSRIEEVSLGEDGPVINTKDEEELATNRRVELVLLDFNGNLVRYKVADSLSEKPAVDEPAVKAAHGER